MNKICLSVILREDNDVPQLIERIAGKEPDLVEFRLDCSKNLSFLAKVSKVKDYPIIATDRSGRDPLETKKILYEAAEIGFDYIDVDLAHPFADAIIRNSKTRGVQVITSHHDSFGTPYEDTLMQLLHLQINAGSDICKIVTSATKANDNLTILDFVSKSAKVTKIVSFAMGKLGVPREFSRQSLGRNSHLLQLTTTQKPRLVS